MNEQPTAEEITQADFRVGLRGYDREEVDEHLRRLAGVIADLQTERDRLVERLGEFAERDLKREFETVGREVTAVLEAARNAADAMRERATADAARWRSEAAAEAEQLLREARADAEALRSDAWTTGTQLLEQVQAEVERRREALESEALAIRGEAEREAHRLTSSARREAEDLARSSKMEAEKLLARAKSEYDQVIATAQRQADAAQERTRALEERRSELMRELESVRATLASMEQELEVRRQGIGLSEPTALPTQAVVADEGEPVVTDWEEGQTVRIIRPDREPVRGDEEDVTDGVALAEEVARLRQRRDVEASTDAQVDEIDADPEPETSEAEAEPSAYPQEDGEPAALEDETSEPEDVSADLSAEEDSDTATLEIEAPPIETGAETRSDEVADDVDDVTVSESEEATPDVEEADPEPTAAEADDLASLFARLRSPAPAPPLAEEEGVVTSVTTHREPHESNGVKKEAEADRIVSNGEMDPFETRERLLLPITNAALRVVKRTLAEAQNEALESLRVSSGDWTPDADHLQALFGDDLESLVDQAGQAGLEAAVEMGLTGVASLSPSLPAPDDFGKELANAIAGALDSAGPGTRERQAAASRVFRGWRTDQAERRLRAAAFAAYHSALRVALESRDRSWRWVPSGKMCPTCREAAEQGRSVPPAHRDCSCTIVPG